MRGLLRAFLVLCLAVWPQIGAADGSRPESVRGTVVDMQGNPVAGAVVRSTLIRDSGVAEEGSAVTTDATGAFRFPEPLNTLGRYLNLTAANADGLQLGWLNAGRIGAIGPETTFPIVVKPAREMTVKVTDAADAPVRDATVALLVAMSAGSPRSMVGEGRTGADGVVRLRYPADAKAGSVFALKSGAGLATWAAAETDGLPSDQPEVPQEL